MSYKDIYSQGRQNIVMGLFVGLGLTDYSEKYTAWRGLSSSSSVAGPGDTSAPQKQALNEMRQHCQRDTVDNRSNIKRQRQTREAIYLTAIASWSLLLAEHVLDLVFGSCPLLEKAFLCDEASRNTFSSS